MSSWLTLRRIVIDAVITEDSDLLAFGCSRVNCPDTQLYLNILKCVILLCYDELENGTWPFSFDLILKQL